MRNDKIPAFLSAKIAAITLVVLTMGLLLLTGCAEVTPEETTEISTETTEATESTDSTTVTTEDTAVFDVTIATEAVEEDHTHEWEDAVVAPTCINQGYTTHTCKICGQALKDSYINATGHSWGDWVTVKDATTISSGSAERKCSVCGKTETRVIDKLPSAEHTHSYKETVTTKATCSQTGVKTFTCSCGSTYTEEITKTAHTYQDTVVAPKCTANGYTKHICSACGSSYVDNYVNANGHAWGGWTTVTTPTTTSTGIAQRSCASCGVSETKTLEKLTLEHTHNYTVTETVAATCTSDGYVKKACSCGDTITETLASSGHNWEYHREEGHMVENTVCTCGWRCALGDGAAWQAHINSVPFEDKDNHWDSDDVYFVVDTPAYDICTICKTKK